MPSLCPTGNLGLWGLGRMANWMHFRPTQKYSQWLILCDQMCGVFFFFFSPGWQECLNSGLQGHCWTLRCLWPPQQVLGDLEWLPLCHLWWLRQLWMNHRIPRISNKTHHVGNLQHGSCQNNAMTKEADVIPGCRIPSVGVERWYYSNSKGMVCLVLVPTLEKNYVDNLDFTKE